uniref:Uncharacterized protein n=1 Tax=Rhizophora mucronata TaxID=61149 RepID=A0A2P2P047_RHIMU
MFHSRIVKGYRIFQSCLNYALSCAVYSTIDMMCSSYRSLWHRPMCL